MVAAGFSKTTLNHELERADMGAVVAYFGVTCLHRPRETTQDVGRNSRFRNQNLNPGPLEHINSTIFSAATFGSNEKT